MKKNPNNSRATTEETDGPIRQVVDEAGAVHTLAKKIGAGGQGEVWLAEGGRRIVKLLRPDADAERLRRQFAFVRRLDLGGLHVAKPIAVLKKPYVGYVAEFLDDMVSIKTLMSPRKDLLRWHIETGSLRRRLRLLAHAGEALLGLHAKGVVYADVSHNNVFISQPVSAVESWLIDLDNLTHDSDPRRAIFTPGYGAPEVVAGRSGCTSLSDAWAFAVLVWHTLTLHHPFVGDLVNDGDPELEEQAFAGDLPWVGHSTDDRNRCTTGLPAELVLASRLLGLAKSTFEDGLIDRKKRTSIADWVDRLHIAADQTVRCPSCGGTYFANADACSWCQEPRTPVTQLKLTHWHPDRGLVDGATRLWQLPLTHEGIVLPRRVTEGRSGIAGRTPHVELTCVPRGVSVRTAEGCTAWVAPVSNALRERHEVSGRGRIIPPTGWMVFFEDPSKIQRVAMIGRSS
jgi:DNA-binding helix-hairpin-helix protein with protein kinase domain